MQFGSIVLALLLGAALHLRIGVQAKELALSVNAFARDFYEQLADDTDDTNIIFSPLATSLGVAMVYNGAAGKTDRQIRQTMKYEVVSPTKEELNEMFFNMWDMFKDPTNQFTSNFVNKLYGPKDYSYNEEFKGVMAKYGAPLETLDLKNDLKWVVTHINDYVAEKTEIKIKNILEEGNIKTNSSMILISALYFQGIWQDAFNKADTELRPFFMSDGKSVDIDMMYTETDFNHKVIDNLKCSVLEIPYKGRAVSMFILLPLNKSKDAISTLEFNLKGYDVNTIFEDLTEKPVKVILPKFSIEENIDLAFNLAEIGMDDLFNENVADLSGMSESKGVYVSTARHKSLLTVEETGSIEPPPVNHTANASSAEVLFEANRPFIFMVREKSTNVILLMGRYADPSSSASAVLLSIWAACFSLIIHLYIY